jgi:hypothetical protein
MAKIQPLSNSKITNSLPSVQQFGYPHGANSAAQGALRTQLAQNNEQMALINQHSGGSKNTPLHPERIVVPQAPTNGMGNVGPVSGNSNATHAAGTLTQSLANAQYDKMVGIGGSRKSRKRRRYRRRKTTKKRKPKKRSRKKRTKHRRKHKKSKSRRR